MAYDEYLLKRNMDDIFEDMVQDKDGATNKESANVTSLGVENATINPRFEGGPHPELNHLPDLTITSTEKQKLLNFS